MKKIIIFVLTTLLFSQPAHATESKTECDLMKRAFIEAMLDKIGNAVRINGTNRLWYRGVEEILDVSRPDPRKLTHFNVTIRVQTFAGPHNPPYALETMTIKLPEGEVINYNIKWLKP